MKFKINQKVRVIKLSDETGDETHLNEGGVIKYLDYLCGCGQSYPDDPMIGIEFSNGIVEEYWKEEIGAS